MALQLVLQCALLLEPRPLWVGSTYKSDAEIKDDIESEYFWSPFVDGGDIDISVDDGTTTLTGEVDSWSEMDSARENAYEGGARKVINKLEIATN